MKKKNLSDLTGKQKEEEITKLGTSLLVAIPNDAPFGLVLAALTSVLAFQLSICENPQGAFKTVVDTLEKCLNKHSHDKDASK